MGEIVHFPRRPHWTAIHIRFWNASLDRLNDYIATRIREDIMSDMKFEYPANAPLMITTRTFNAPRALVWTCFSRPEHVVRWWGPKSISPIIKLDKFEFRVGGKWRFVTERPDGTETIVFHGTYKDIVRPEKIVNTFAVEGMYAEDDLLAETHTFEARGDTTYYRAVANLGTIEARDGVVAGGMETGAREALTQLDELLAELLETAK